MARHQPDRTNRTDQTTNGDEKINLCIFPHKTQNAKARKTFATKHVVTFLKTCHADSRRIELLLIRATDSY